MPVTAIPGCCCCCSHINSQCSPWSQDRLQLQNSGVIVYCGLAHIYRQHRRAITTYNSSIYRCCGTGIITWTSTAVAFSTRIGIIDNKIVLNLLEPQSRCGDKPSQISSTLSPKQDCGSKDCGPSGNTRVLILTSITINS